ncbi:ELWxxDGT repeat protein, partial [Halotia wernerae UHCC 0503]|nr:ELWxxDGT repeat protein [Halotia wernerae UHCC 0503]
MAKPYLVKDINSGSSDSTPNDDRNSSPQLTNINGTLYFAANDGIRGNEVWKSDGTEAGTVLLKDIYSGITSDYYFGFGYNFTNVDGILYFTAEDGTVNKKLWKSDGTDVGTVLVGDFDYNALSEYSFSRLTNVNGNLYFSAYNRSKPIQLWKSDGTQEGTVLVKDFQLDPRYYGIQSVINANGIVYFNIFSVDAESNELWKSDGTEAGTVFVKDIFWNTSVLANNIASILYFNAYDDTLGYELWKSDGTEGGTVLVKDINSGFASSNPSELTNINNTLYFFADDGIHGNELWKSDGTENGTVLVKDINSGSDGSTPFNLTIVDNVFYFFADDGIHGNELWKSDGTENGTVLVKDINSGSGNSASSVNNSFPDLTNVNGIVYFFADDGIHGKELWKSDGTENGTVLVEDIVPGSAGSNSSDLTNVDGVLYFYTDDSIHGKELWALNTNPPVTSPIVSITAIDTNAAEDGNTPGIFRISRTGDTSTALTVKYNIDGTADNKSDYNQINGTITIDVGQSFADIIISPVDDIFKEGSETVTLTLFNQSDYAIDASKITATVVIADNASTAIVPTQLYLVKDIYPGNNNDYETEPYNLTNVNGTLYFTADDGINGQELWKSDGTQEGTVLVKDIKPGSDSSNIFDLTKIDGTLYFTADDGINGQELWK